MKITLALALFATSGCFAQSAMYRCGNSYTETPCGSNAVVLKAPAQVVKVVPVIDNPPSEDVIAANMVLCEKDIRVQLKDPASAQVRLPLRMGPGVLYRNGGTYPVIDYSVGINAKNSYGGYTGEKLWVCSFNPTETALLLVKEIGPYPR